MRKTKIRSGNWTAAVPRLPLGEGDALVEPEQVVGLALRRLVLDQDHHVAHVGGQLVRDPVERPVDERLEPLAVHVDRHAVILPEDEKRPAPLGTGRC